MTVNAPGRSRRQIIVLNGALQLGILLFCFLVIEVMLRIAFAHSLDFAMEMWKYAAQLKQPVDNPNLCFVHAPNRSALLMGVPVSINSRGYRDREFEEAKLPDVYRIIMLGDSTAFCWGVPAEYTVAKILERELNHRGVPGRRFEVINAGVGNYNTVQEFTHYLTYDRAFHPDLVVLEYFINDAEPVPRWRELPVLGRSYLVAFAISRFDAVLRAFGTRPDWKEYYAGLYLDDRPGLRAAKEALVNLAAATRADGAKLLVTILPELREIDYDYPFTEAHRKIKDVLAASHVPVMELIDGLRGHSEATLWVTPADDHPNAKANSLIAAQVLPWILQNVGADPGIH